MPEQSIAELILKIVADSSEVRQALQEASDSQKKFAKDTKDSSTEASNAVDSALDKTAEKSKKTQVTMERFGAGMRQVGRSLTMAGALIMGPVVGALAVAGKTSGVVSLAMYDLGKASRDFSTILAEAAVPVVEKFTKLIEDLTKWFKSLPEWLQESIVQTALLSGAFLVLSGIIVRLIYLFGILNTALIIPLRAAFAALGATLVAAVGIPLATVLLALSIFAVAWVNSWFGVRDMTKAVLGVIGASIDWLYDRLMRIVLTLTNKAGGMSWSEAWKSAGEAVMAARKVCDEEGTGMEERLKSMEVTAANAVDKIRAKLSQLLTPPGKGGEGKIGAITNFAAGWEKGLKEMRDQFENWGNTASAMATQFAQVMQSAFSDFFFDVFSGEMKSMEEYMASFGQAILRMITNLIAQLIALWVVTTMLNAIPGGAAVLSLLGMAPGGAAKKHEGGYIRKAHDGLSTEEFPIITQKGEGILSRNGMATLGSEDRLNQINNGGGMGGGQTINLVQVIQAWSPEDIYRNKKMLASGMIEELEKNGAFRSAINKYK